MLNKKLKLSPSVLKRYEPELGIYCFYDARTGNCINMDSVSGAVAAALDGTLCTSEVVEILLANNSISEPENFAENLCRVFNGLLKEEFLVEVD